MSTFRRYGGLNYSANSNVTRSYISNSEQLNINNYSGQPNSKEIFASHIDLSGNSILHTGTIYFQDGTSLSSATNQGPAGATGAPEATGTPGAVGNIIGEIKMYGGAGNNPPNGFLWCDGSKVNKTTYNNLYEVIGDKYGDSGDQSNFMLPNLKQRFPIGARNTNDMDIIYNGVSSINGGNQTMNSNQLAQHTHSWNGNIGYGGATNIGLGAANIDASSGGNKNIVVSDGGESIFINVNGTVGQYPTTQEDILPPFTVVNFIICYQA
jgi:microcystin-dependent protein